MQLPLPELEPILAHKRTRLPSYARVAHPPGHELVERDRRILEAIYRFDGVLADYQIERLFFTSATPRKMRLFKLFQHGYIARPTEKQRRILDFMVYWLDRAGIEYIASTEGLTLSQLHWRKHGERWTETTHDIELNDFRMDVLRSCTASGVALEEWYPESAFRKLTDQISYTTADAKRAAKAFRPDDYYLLRHGQAHPNRLFVEWDRSTMDITRFIRTKVRPYLTYVESGAYWERFGHKSGRFIVITGSQRRAQNMKAAVERTNLKRMWDWHFTSREYFSSLVKQSTVNVLIDPIWLQPGKTACVSLFKGLSKTLTKAA